MVCHGATPTSGAPTSFNTRAALAAAAKNKAGVSVVQYIVERMQSNAPPTSMPPSRTTALPAADIQGIQGWISAGMPEQTCVTTTTGGGGACNTGGNAGSGGAGGTGGAGGAPGTGGAGGTGGTTGTGGAATSGTGGAATGGTGGTVVTGTGTFCAVEQVLVKYACQTCHSNPPNSGAPMALLTRANLIAPAVTNRNVTVAALAVQRMQGTPTPMPPATTPTVAAADVASVQRWITAGMPDDCTTGTVTPPPNPFAGPSVCTSGTIAVGANGPTMRPGEACLNCHTGTGGGGDDSGGNSGPGGGGDDGEGGGDDGAAAGYTIAGTVFPTAHEPNDCVSNRQTATTVQVFDAAGRVITMTPNTVGNFFTAQAVTFPITAIVSRAGLQRAMTTRQTNGNCNSCHTQNGANGAPGRILAP
jgi:hypothetical protein